MDGTHARAAVERIIGGLPLEEVSDADFDSLFADAVLPSWLPKARAELLEALSLLYLERRGYSVVASSV